MDIQISILAYSYFIGSIPFGLILSYIGGIGDIRKIGSGNIGATNVFRKSKLLALLTLFLDSAKGYLTVVLAKSYIPDQTFIFISSLLCIIGHMFPIWLLFRGGKGVATLLGSIASIDYRFAICFLLVWMAIFINFKYVSLSSITSTVITLLMTYIYCTKMVFTVFFIIALLIITQHIDNLLRIIRGTENKINIKN